MASSTPRSPPSPIAGVCPYGLAFVDNPVGDLDHDGLRTTSSVPIYTFTDAYATSGSSAPPAFSADSGVVTVNQFESFNPAAQANEGHYYAECSNKGLCDRTAGLCVCYDGYTGSSCQRTTCPNDCSGHGICRTVDEIAIGSNNLNQSIAAGSVGFTTPYAGLNVRQTDNRAGQRFFSGITQTTLYRLWDQDKAQSCVCDAGFSGPDCSRRECPRGDDPLTHRFSDCPKQSTYAGTYTLAAPCVQEIQTVTLAASADGQDWFKILYRDWTGKIWATDDFAIGSTGASAPTTVPLAQDQATVQYVVAQALQQIPNGIIPAVTVAATSTAHGWVIAITFTKNSGNLYPIQFVNTADAQLNLPIISGSDTAATFTATTAEQDGNTELSTCSNRGVCDYDAGLCKCFKGYYGGDCSNQNALAQ